MHKKIQNILIIFTPFFLITSWVGYIIYSISLGTEVKLRIQGYDPRDLLAGYYIEYTIDWNNTDCRQFENNICPEEEFAKKNLNRGRFYTTKEDAQQLEKELQDSNNKAEIIYSYHKNKYPYALRLLINGKSWENDDK